MERNKVARKTRKGASRIDIEKVAKKSYNYISNYQSSEAIVKTVLDKIIDLSLQMSYNNIIDNKLNNFCFDFIHNQLEPLFEENYMSYTKSKNTPNALFWKRKKPPENEWIEIIEPETVAMDRFEGFRAHFKEIIKHKKIKIGQIEEKVDTEKNDESKKENEKKNEKRNSLAKRNSILKDKIKQNNKKVVNESKINNNKEDKNNQNQNNKSQIKNQMFNFPSSDIPGYDEEFNHEAYDPPNIEKLRKEKDQEIKIKEKERKQREEMLKMAKKKEEEEKLKQTKKKDKPIDSRKFTFDSNGMIIKFKQYKLDKLTKDFRIIKNGVKNEVKPKKNKTIKDKDKSTTPNDNEILVEKEVITRNPEDEEKEKKDKKESTKAKTITEMNQEKIIPSGSNFKIMLPNIGVVIKEDKKIKEGGREFNKFFNKYSIHDYETILNEYIPLQNKTRLGNNMKKLNLTMNNININKRISESVDNANANNKSVANVQNHFKNTGNLNVNANANVNNDIENNNSSVYLRTSIGANSFIKNNYNPLMTSDLRSFMNYSKEKIDNSFKDSIMMKRGGTSLKLEIESINDLRNEKTYYGIKNIKQQNLFGKNFMKNYKIGLFKPAINNSIVTLNKDILTDANWGNKIGGEKEDKQENIFFAKHYTKQQVMRELGSSFLSGMKVKLPRVRKVEINK